MSEKKPLTDLDAETIPNTYQMLKACVPFLPPEKQKFFAIFIKFSELKSVMDYYKQNTVAASSHGNASLSDILQAIRVYMNDDVSEQLDTICNVMTMMNTMKEMGDGNLENLVDMLSPDQKEMFETFKEMNAKGDSEENNE